MTVWQQPSLPIFLSLSASAAGKWARGRRRWIQEDDGSDGTLLRAYCILYTHGSLLGLNGSAHISGEIP
uniref:Uncharacterized protein n=1 Tax=Oryza sativa subsp. japonica TaxID=39947 RepID=Q69UX1_ORYSJ|nr:hypothetical protein [Oryza sativa Japonica Group]